MPILWHAPEHYERPPTIRRGGPQVEDWLAGLGFVLLCGLLFAIC